MRLLTRRRPLTYWSAVKVPYLCKDKRFFDAVFLKLFPCNGARFALVFNPELTRLVFFLEMQIWETRVFSL